MIAHWPVITFHAHLLNLRSSFVLTFGHTPGAPLLIPMTKYTGSPFLNLSIGTRAHEGLLTIMTPAMCGRPGICLTLLLRINLRGLECLTHARLWHLPIDVDSSTLPAMESFATNWCRPTHERRLLHR